MKALLDLLMGPAQARAAHQQALRQQPGIGAGVRQLQTICPPDAQADTDAPIFLLSAGWRSGSTLLQRLLMSDPNVLIWGEPYDECGLIQALAGSMRAFRSGWPPAAYFYDGRPPHALTGDWVANLFPALDDWRRGQRALFDTMIAKPAIRAGVRRWGIKEVRLTSEHAWYLKWLYPHARFLLLFRDPLDAYRSYSAYGRSWYDTFPDRPVFTPSRFGAHWARLMRGFLSDAQALDAMMIKYEDVIGGGFDTTTIDRYLDIRTDPSVLARRIGGFQAREKGARPGWLERQLLLRQVARIGREVGYSL